MEQVTHSLSVTRGVLDDDHHLSHPYAYSDAVNALEADIKSLGVRVHVDHSAVSCTC